jgi:hypothetical protein
MKTITTLALLLVFNCIFLGQIAAQDDAVPTPENLGGIVAGQLIISEFRVRGPNGANDEFIEIYNASGFDHTVAAFSGTGYGVAASDGTTRCSIPNGTVIPNRGHYLCVNSVGYSLASYPAGNGTTATGNATYTTDIPDNAGIAIFNNNSGGGSYSLANRIDAVGSTSEANTTYKEGTGYPALTPFSIDYSFSRDECGKGGLIAAFQTCTLTGPRDTNNNAADFIFNDTNGTSAGAGQRLGVPGPQNLSSPLAPSRLVSTFKVTPLDTCAAPNSAPNRVRDFTSDPPNNSTFGTLDIRRTFTNNTGANTTRLRYRIVDLTTFPAPSGVADLRPRTSGDTVVTVDRGPCSTGTSNITVHGTTLEQPPSQPNGGGFNSSLSSGTITLGTPLANGASIDVRFLFGIQQTGAIKVGIYLESLPGGGTFFYVNGTTDNPWVGSDSLADFDGDSRTDISIFRPSVGQWWTRRSFNGATSALTFGASTDKIVPADYTGDGKADIAFFRPSTGQWFILRSEDNSFYATTFGVNTDIPSPADFDGDGKADVALYRPSTGTWYISKSSGGTTIAAFGGSTDNPIPADFDGDTKADLAIWRPTGSSGVGEWWILYSATGTVFAAPFGVSTDKAVAGDWTGDGKADCAFWRPSNGQWYVLRSDDNSSYFAFPFGLSTDTPVPGDYDGDGKFDAAVFRSSTSTWYANNSLDGSTSIVTFGASTDQAVPNAFVR